MKTFFMLLFTVGTLITGLNETQETQTAVATYIGTDNGEYYFAQGDQKVAFQAVDEAVASVVNLADDSMVGKSFKIDFTTVDEEDENGQVVQTRTITSLTPEE